MGSELFRETIDHSFRVYFVNPVGKVLKLPHHHLDFVKKPQVADGVCSEQVGWIGLVWQACEGIHQVLVPSLVMITLYG